MSTPDAGGFVGTLRETDAIGRYAVAYLRTLAAQAGLGFDETASGEDVDAIDCSLVYPGRARAEVQVKGTTRPFTKGATLSFPVHESWQSKWSELKVPGYFVVVKLWERDCDGWIRHDGQTTCHTATAYWAPIDPTNIPGTIKVTQSSPLTLETLREWAIDVRRRFQ
jgi:hypothetical protein